MEEESRVEAEARAAYLEHQLLSAGKEPFPSSQRSHPLEAASSGADGAVQETYGVIERQVRRIQALEQQVRDFTEAEERRMKLKARRGSGEGNGAWRVAC